MRARDETREVGIIKTDRTLNRPPSPVLQNNYLRRISMTSKYNEREMFLLQLTEYHKATWFAK